MEKPARLGFRSSSSVTRKYPADRDRIPNVAPNTLGVTVSGSSELWGVEFESSAILTDGWDATLNVAWSDNQYTEFTSTSYVGIIGTTNCQGPQRSQSLSEMDGESILYLYAAPH